MAFELPKLEYPYDALEPYIDKETMEIHHGKHHKAYIDKLNEAIKGHEELEGKEIEWLLRDLDTISEQIRTAVKNHGGGHFNHTFFWKILKKDIQPKGEILEAIRRDFQSHENFLEQFKNAAITQFGSGWAWLVSDPGSRKLEIMQTSNQESPISLGKIPLLGIDVWEHAYYLKYKNKRPEYVDAFINVINWEQVNENYLRAIKN